MSIAFRSPRRAVVLIAFVGVGVRIVWQLLTGFYDGPLTYEEEELAQQILAGAGYGYYFRELGTTLVSFGTLGLPLLLVLIHLIDPGFTLVGVMQAGLSVVVVAGAYVLGRRLLSPTAGVLAALLVAVHPALIIMSARAVISAVYDHALAAAVFVAAAALLSQRTTQHAIVFGVLSALGAFFRPTIGVASAAGLAVIGARPPRKALAIALAVFLTVPVALAVRNAIALGASGSTTMVCVQLWLGNNPNASGGAFTADGRQGLFDALPPDLQAVVGRPEPEIGRAFCDAAFDFLGADIPRALGWQLTKLYYFWWFSPLAGMLYVPGMIEVYKVLYAIELLFAVAGAVAAWRVGRGTLVLMLLAMMLAISVSQVLFYVEGRHRLIIECPLAAFAACGVVAVGRALRASRSSGSNVTSWPGRVERTA